MLKYLAIAAGCLTLSGCLLPGDYARMREAAMQDQACRSWGLKPGTLNYVNCRVELAREQIARDAEADAAIASWNRAQVQTMQSMHTCTYGGGTMTCW